MGGYPEKITRTILAYGDLSLKLHVRVKNDKKEPLHIEYDYGDRSYLKLDFFTFLSLDIMSQGEWDTSKSVMISQLNIFSVIQTFRAVIKDIYDAGIFAVNKSGNIVIYKEKARECMKQVNLLNTTSVIAIEPTIVYDDNESEYEGVNLYINKPENNIQLSIQVFESLCYTLEQIDLFRYSQLVMNYFTSYYSSDKKVFKKEKKEIVKRQVDFSTPVEETKSTFVKPKKDGLFDGLKPSE